MSETSVNPQEPQAAAPEAAAATQPEKTPQRPPAGPFVRRLQGANLSLEVNTQRVPADGACYVLQEGETVFRSMEYTEALTEYQRLCAEYWERMLDDPDAMIRLRAARGLYAQDPTHPRALAILKADGDGRDRRRLEQANARNAYQKRAAAQRIR